MSEKITHHVTKQLQAVLTSPTSSTFLEWKRIMGPEYLLLLYIAFFLVASSRATICSRSLKLSSSVRAASASSSSCVKGLCSTTGLIRLGLTCKQQRSVRLSFCPRRFNITMISMWQFYSEHNCMDSTSCGARFTQGSTHEYLQALQHVLPVKQKVCNML